MNDFRETLYTVDKRGHRKWVYSDIVKGRFFKLRAIVAYTLMAFYLLMPWISINGKQAILLDIPSRKFIFFGTTFWATDTMFLFLVLGGLGISLFLFTAMFGRVWCGWACPETVFLEFLFRPIERLIEGSRAERMRLDKAPWSFNKIAKKSLKHLLCAVLSWVIASTALAYFIGREPLLNMMTDWPGHHPLPFVMTLIIMGLMAFQFGWFREQFCTVLCPYARFQSVLMDADTITVGYDQVRGEPRGKLARKSEENNRGDCIDCKLCIRVCPTGIDIRNGNQLECISCTACIDACDFIMEKIGRPKGLIRYDTENRLYGRPGRFLRPRVFVYSVILLAFIGSFFTLLEKRALTEFQILRGTVASPFILQPDGNVTNQLRVHVSNKSEQVESYTFSSPASGVKLITPLSPFKLKAGEIREVPLFVTFSKDRLKDGKFRLKIILNGSSGYKGEQEITLLGPDE
ncbi:MAG: cytochrome c oxidase accessory protein CcoG [Candidatus Dadabacteria bacterium]|nr:MAG: cytochrome c oxidase accessory protein CcoG [Candidatus Dadabacteria bacterium]